MILGGRAAFLAFSLAVGASSLAGQAPRLQPSTMYAPNLSADVSGGSEVILATPGQVTLQWTAPGDDGNIGTANHYVVKYSTNAISESNWTTATTVPNPPAPLPAGTRQAFTFSGLTPGARYYFAVKSYDEVGNASFISNVVRKFAGGITVPATRRAIVDSVLASATLKADTVAADLPVMYQFALDVSKSFANPSLAADSLIDSLAAVTFTSLNRGSLYFWRCRALARNRSDSSLWSAPDSFIVQTIPVDTPTVALNAPDGGEAWPAGSTKSIKWTDSDNSGISSYKLEYSNNAGQAWALIQDWSPGDPRVYSWVVPRVLSQQCRVRVSVKDNSGLTDADISNSNFTIGDSLPPTVTVVSPNGGERWLAGASYAITWSDTDNIGVSAYKLEYSVNAGTAWSLIQDWLAGDPHTYNWVVPIVVSQQCLVRVSVRDNSGLTAADISNSNFAIGDSLPPSVAVVSPNGGEKWLAGTAQSITWSDSDNIGVSSYKLEYSTNAGSAWSLIQDWLAGDPHTYNWVVPVTISQQCRIRISVRDNGGLTATDISNANFEIADNTPPTVTLTTPHGGEKWRVGSTNNISWSDSDNIAVTDHKLEYSTNNGSSWILIMDWTAGDPHLYAWTIPNTPSLNCLVRVSVRDAAGNTASDNSNRVFRIRTGPALIGDEIPQDYFLSQSYPNPFNAVTNIDYGLPADSHVTFEIYDVTGRLVTTLLDEYQTAGYHRVTWNSSGNPSGTYFYRIEAGQFEETEKMTVIK